jgi:hypothetical protein
MHVYRRTIRTGRYHGAMLHRSQSAGVQGLVVGEMPVQVSGGVEATSPKPVLAAALSCQRRDCLRVSHQVGRIDHDGLAACAVGHRSVDLVQGLKADALDTCVRLEPQVRRNGFPRVPDHSTFVV